MITEWYTFYVWEWVPGEGWALTQRQVSKFNRWPWESATCVSPFNPIPPPKPYLYHAIYRWTGSYWVRCFVEQNW